MTDEETPRTLRVTVEVRDEDWDELVREIGFVIDKPHATWEMEEITDDDE